MNVVNFISRGKNFLKQRYFRKKRFVSKTIQAGLGTQVAVVEYSPSIGHQRSAAQNKPLLSFNPQEPIEWQSSARKKLSELVGYQDQLIRAEAKNLWWAEDKHAIFEKIQISDGDGRVFPVYKCYPKGVKPPYRWVICLQGHSSGMHNSIGVDFDAEEFVTESIGGRDFANWCIKNGYAALCIEQMSLGERNEKRLERTSPHPCHDAAMHALILGKTLMAERMRDVQIGLEFLRQSEPSGLATVGIMGNSLGGSVGVYCGALLGSQLDFVIAGSCVSSIDQSLLRIYHCADLYVPSLRKYFEFGDILGMIAPKPLLIVQGRDDPIFPVSGCEDAVSHARHIYSSLKAADRLQMLLGEGGHQFYPELATKGLHDLGLS